MWRATIFFGLLVGFGLISMTQASRAADDPKSQPDLAKAKVDAAQAAYEKYWDLYDNKAVTVDAEKIYLWLRRWMEALHEVHDKNEDRLTAAEAHLDRMKRLEKRAREKAVVGQGATEEVVAVKFYRVEAEGWVAQRKKEK
jgi:hypothetical protein